MSPVVWKDPPESARRRGPETVVCPRCKKLWGGPIDSNRMLAIEEHIRTCRVEHRQILRGGRCFTPCCGKRTNRTDVASAWGVIASPDPADNPEWWERYAMRLERGEE